MDDAQQRGVNVNIIIGNELEKLKAGPQKYYRVIVVEMSRGSSYFNRYTKSHVSPEALRIFDQALADAGFVCFHTSSRHDNITGDVADLANKSGWSHRAATDPGDRNGEVHFSSEWVMLGRRDQHLSLLTRPPIRVANNGFRWVVLHR